MNKNKEQEWSRFETLTDEEKAQVKQTLLALVYQYCGNDSPIKRQILIGQILTLTYLWFGEYTKNMARGNEELADSALTKALEAVWTKLDNLQNPYGYTTWVYRALYHNLMDEYRRADDPHLCSLSHISQRFLERKTQAFFPDIELLVERETEIWELREQIKKLPKKQQDVLNLILDGYKEREIAEILDININTVKSRKRCAVQKLRELMAKPERPSDKGRAA